MCVILEKCPAALCHVIKILEIDISLGDNDQFLSTNQYLF